MQKLSYCLLLSPALSLKKLYTNAMATLQYRQYWLWTFPAYSLASETFQFPRISALLSKCLCNSFCDFNCNEETSWKHALSGVHILHWCAKSWLIGFQSAARIEWSLSPGTFLFSSTKWIKNLRDSIVHQNRRKRQQIMLETWSTFGGYNRLLKRICRSINFTCNELGSTQQY